MGNNKAIQILRSSYNRTNDGIKDVELLDGQLFYSKDDKQLHIGDKHNYSSLKVGATLPIGAANVVPTVGGNSEFSGKVGIGLGTGEDKINLDTDSHDLVVGGSSQFNDYLYAKGGIGIGQDADDFEVGQVLRVKGNSYFDGIIEANDAIIANSNITATGSKYIENSTKAASDKDRVNLNRYGLNMSNSDIIGCNSIYFNDNSDTSMEGIHFMQTNLDDTIKDTNPTKIHSLWCTAGGTLNFTPDRAIGTEGTPMFSVKNNGDVTCGSINANGTAYFNGNVTFNGDLVYSNSSYNDYPFVSFKAGNDGGCGVLIGAGGYTGVGSGESVHTVFNGRNKYAYTEDLCLSSDETAYIYTNCGTGNGFSGAEQFTFGKDGTLTAKTFIATSDKRLKENFIPYTYEKSILDLPVYKYNFINDESKKEHIGCLAQDLQEICPEIVHEGSDGYLSINENKIVYLLLEEVKKLKKEIDELKK